MQNPYTAVGKPPDPGLHQRTHSPVQAQISQWNEFENKSFIVLTAVWQISAVFLITKNNLVFVSVLFPFWCLCTTTLTEVTGDIAMLVMKEHCAVITIKRNYFYWSWKSTPFIKGTLCRNHSHLVSEITYCIQMTDTLIKSVTSLEWVCRYNNKDCCYWVLVLFVPCQEL